MDSDVIDGLSLQIAQDLLDSCNALCGDVNRLIQHKNIQLIHTLEQKLKDIKYAQTNLESQVRRETTMQLALEAQVAKITNLEQQLEEVKLTENVDAQTKIENELAELVKSASTTKKTLEQIASTKARLENELKEGQDIEKQLTDAMQCKEFAELNDLKSKLQSKTILDFFDEPTMNRIIEKIKKDEGRIKFKTGLKYSAIKMGMNSFLFSNKRVIDYVKSFFPLLISTSVLDSQGHIVERKKLPTLDEFCAGSYDCNMKFLGSTIKTIIDDFNKITTTSKSPWNVYEYIEDIFELKPESAGGRRTCKQKHRRHKTRGHKSRMHKNKTRGSRRHNRHSTRKHH
jgi:hypothetical protein